MWIIIHYIIDTGNSCCKFFDTGRKERKTICNVKGRGLWLDFFGNVLFFRGFYVLLLRDNMLEIFEMWHDKSDFVVLLSDLKLDDV